MSTSDFELNYEQLAETYVERLHTTLRHFNVGPEFLETWVHEEDPNYSIYGIFESAEMGDVNTLNLSVGGKTAKKLKVDWLKGELAKLGMLEVVNENDGLLIKMQFGKGQ